MTKYPMPIGGTDIETFHDSQRAKFARREADRRKTAMILRLFILMNGAALIMLASGVVAYLSYQKWCTR